VLNALGGDCLEDFDRLREDDGLREMLGHEVPSPETARKFLYQFHDEEKLKQAQSELPTGQVSYIPDESAPLRSRSLAGAVRWPGPFGAGADTVSFTVRGGKPCSKNTRSPKLEPWTRT
jgi:hypothetical protein